MENVNFREQIHKNSRQKSHGSESGNIACLKNKHKNDLNESIEQTFKSIFSEEELMFIADIHRGSEFDEDISYRPNLLRLRITETENLDELIKKNAVNLQSIIIKIMRLSNDETAALIEWACHY